MSSDVCVVRDDQTEECVVVIPDGPFICAVFSHDGDTLLSAPLRSSRLDCTALAASALLPLSAFVLGCRGSPLRESAGTAARVSGCSEAPTKVRLS